MLQWNVVSKEQTSAKNGRCENTKQAFHYKLRRKRGRAKIRHITFVNTKLKTDELFLFSLGQGFILCVAHKFFEKVRGLNQSVDLDWETFDTRSTIKMLMQLM